MIKKDGSVTRIATKAEIVTKAGTVTETGVGTVTETVAKAGTVAKTGTVTETVTKPGTQTETVTEAGTMNETVTEAGTMNETVNEAGVALPVNKNVNKKSSSARKDDVAGWSRLLIPMPDGKVAPMKVIQTEVPGRYDKCGVKTTQKILTIAPDTIDQHPRLQATSSSPSDRNNTVDTDHSYSSSLSNLLQGLEMAHKKILSLPDSKLKNQGGDLCDSPESCPDPNIPEISSALLVPNFSNQKEFDQDSSQQNMDVNSEADCHALATNLLGSGDQNRLDEGSNIHVAHEITVGESEDSLPHSIIPSLVRLTVPDSKDKVDQDSISIEQEIVGLMSDQSQSRGLVNLRLTRSGSQDFTARDHGAGIYSFLTFGSNSSNLGHKNTK